MSHSPVLRGFSPYNSPLNSHSPWSQGSQFGSSEGSGYDSLTLPPINPDADNDLGELPSFLNNGDFFSHPFLLEAQASTSGSRSQEQQEPAPPPLNQQARPSRPRALFSQYTIAGSESPDPFDGDFADLAAFVDGLSPPHSPPAQMVPSRTTTRRSSYVDLTSSSPDARMVSTRKRKATEDAGQGRAPKRTARALGSDSNSRRQSLADVQVVDLANVEDESQYRELAAKQQAELIKKQNEDEARKPVKLAEFQCIICMDNPTDLTVTHCGHLFCSECLHQALHAGDKKSCPVCRTPISTATSSKGKQPKNGIFALEMKLMTKNKKGKLVAK
ncbi:E3 ubiquitin-protein ligase complex slx8-rfp subunit [Lachnellula occidentalis]|uniref:E3 ubiquitin-protein ligase complex slx8-rfp subunit n=1 Tax=Lachnellula occidentalis TaxID=215460 RepID=A0A8H8U6Q9_9HELO|nr:E3 ubiquitin-protein ligase complex slx8-rfp subunit [Lachnellula occidentalis]